MTDHLSEEVVRLWVYNVCSYAQTFALRTQSPVLYVLPGCHPCITIHTKEKNNNIEQVEDDDDDDNEFERRK